MATAPTAPPYSQIPGEPSTDPFIRSSWGEWNVPHGGHLQSGSAGGQAGTAAGQRPPYSSGRHWGPHLPPVHGHHHLPAPGASSSVYEASVYTVYGIPFDDLDTALTARKVMLISMTMALLALASSILQLVSGVFFSIGIMSAVILPICGYFGTLHRRRWMISFFSFCNMLLAVMFLASFISILIAFDGDYIGCLCDEGCRTAMGIGLCMAYLQCLGGYTAHHLSKKTWFFLQAPGIPLNEPLLGTTVHAPQPAGHGYYRDVDVPSRGSPAGAGGSATGGGGPGARYTYAAGPSGTR